MTPVNFTNDHIVSVIAQLIFSKCQNINSKYNLLPNYVKSGFTTIVDIPRASYNTGTIDLGGGKPQAKWTLNNGITQTNTTIDDIKNNIYDFLDVSSDFKTKIPASDDIISMLKSMIQYLRKTIKIYSQNYKDDLQNIVSATFVCFNTTSDKIEYLSHYNEIIWASTINTLSDSLYPMTDNNSSADDNAFDRTLSEIFFSVLNKNIITELNYTIEALDRSSPKKGGWDK